jgi:alpha-mannosidase/mannosylglycerate hydrolase
MKKRNLQLVVSTHWDREWRETFQDLRYAMVRLIDRAIDALEDGSLAGPFHTDGQTIVLEDYLEIRPERRARVEKLVREGRFETGPWYTMPDEFTVSGESLIRNLRLGREMARAGGARPSDAGYMPDMFGHNSQMPQIFAGCGITGAFIWRGIDTTEKRNFIWRGADGTELPCHKFGPIGYCTWTHQVGRRNEYDRNVEDDPKRFVALVERHLEAEAKATDIDSILILEGGDHQTWNPRQLELLFGALANHPKYTISHTGMDDHLRELVAQRGKITGVLDGELRTPGRPYPKPGEDPFDACGQWVIPGVLSSRVRLKQANSHCQTLLCLWAEPFSAYAHAAIGAEYPQGFLNLAWKSLLQNHAHDSIDSCSIDQVHRDMAYRFDQCRLIADRLATEATSRIAASVEGDLAEREMRVAVFNPLPRDLARVVEVTLEIPANWPCFNEFFGFEPKPAFRLFTADGAEVPYQRLGQAMNRLRQRVRERKWPETVMSNHVKVALPLEIPASGYTTLVVRGTEVVTNTRHPEVPGLATSERSMANERLSVQIEPNGTLTLTDRRNGRAYTRLLTFEERADIGDGWYHGVAANDQVFVSTACRADVALVHNGPMLTTFRIRTVLQVPADFRFDTMTRSERFVDMAVDNLISLRPGQDHLEIETRVDNGVDDHRLRVLFPSGARTDTYLADTPFDVVERPIALRKDNHEFRELEVETKPQQSWTAVHDAKCGLAVVADGLLETAIPDLPERSIALTLFRGTRRTVFTNGEPDGQMRGPLTFRYCLVPLSGAPDRVRLCELGQQLAAGLRVVQLRKEDIEIYRSSTKLKPVGGFLGVAGPAVLSSVRRTTGEGGPGVEVRLFNPGTKAASTRLDAARLAGPGSRGGEAGRVDLESRPLGRIGNVKKGRLTVALKPKQIVTVRIT